MAEILRVRKLSVDFFQKSLRIPAVIDLSFDLQENTSLAVVGESGSGKSTLALAMVNLLPSNAYVRDGEIVYSTRDGDVLDILKLDPFADRLRYIRGNEMGIIFQEPASCLNPLYTVGWQIDEKKKYWDFKSKEVRKADIISKLREMGFHNPEATYHSYPFQLSGGMNQRIMISMALTSNLRLLICDEPTSALDVTTQRQILILLKELQEKYKFAIVFITHNLDIASFIAEQILVMYRGLCVERGKTTKILSDPIHPYTRYLISSGESIKKRSKFSHTRATVGRKINVTGCPFCHTCEQILDECTESLPPESNLEGRIVRCWHYTHKEE